MSVLKIVAVNGSLSAPSRTQVLIDAVLLSLTRRIDAQVQAVSIAGLAPELAATLLPGDPPPKVSAALQSIAQADLLVAASPIYKGAYTGLFKHLFDLVDPQALVAKPVLLVATGGSPRHTLALDHVFRPLFGFFRASTVPSAVYAGPEDFEQGALNAAATLERIEEATSQAAWMLAAHGARHVAPRAREALAA